MTRALPFSAALVLVLVTAGGASAQPTTHFKFSFAPGKAPEGMVAVQPVETYTAERGYGFEPGAAVTALTRDGSAGFCTSDRPFFFSTALPEGNYRVTVTLGDPTSESDTTVKAELRRLMLEGVRTAKGQIVTRSFTVNVRTPHIPVVGDVRLKGRERTAEAWNWDEKLTLEFNGRCPCLRALEITRVEVPTVYLLGDSTVCDQPAEPWNSWGQMLPCFFGPDVAVANHAESGESLRSSLHALRLEKVLSTLRRGDYLLIQYGHNDMKDRGPGVGAFTTYKEDLRHFVKAAKERGATPVVVTSMHRKRLGPDGKIQETLGDYPEAARQVAKEEGVPLIDLHAMSATLYEALGPERIDKAFQDGTHHNAYGSYELARCVIEGIRRSKLDLARFLSADAQPFDPAHPDPVESFHVPPSPQSSSVTPPGS